MASIKVVMLTAKTNKNGESPVVIQINHSYKTRRVTLFSINPKFFDDGKVSKRYKDHVRLTNVINREISKYLERIDRLERSGVPYEVQDIMIKEVVTPTLLIDLVNAYKERQLDLNKRSSARIMLNISDAIKSFDPRVRVKDVSKLWMDRFVNHLRNQDSIKSDSTVGKYIRNLKTVLRSDLTDYFDKSVFSYKNPKSEAVIETLTLAEMKTWQTGKIPARLEICRDFFTFMVHCQGPRASDALTVEPKDVKGGYIHFRELKTGSRKGHGKIKTVAINDTLSGLIDKYKGMSRHYIFPILTQEPDDPKVNDRYRKHINTKMVTVNKNLKLIAAHLQIDKKVTNHVARHTFASMADHENIDIRDIQKMLNHSSLEQTIQYIHRVRKSDVLNEQAQKVLGKLESNDTDL